MPTYGNIGGASKEIKPWYTNINGARIALNKINSNVNGSQKEIYTSQKYHWWKRYPVTSWDESKAITFGDRNSSLFNHEDSYGYSGYSFNSSGTFDFTGGFNITYNSEDSGYNGSTISTAVESFYNYYRPNETHVVTNRAIVLVTSYTYGVFSSGGYEEFTSGSVIYAIPQARSSQYTLIHEVEKIYPDNGYKSIQSWVDSDFYGGKCAYIYDGYYYEYLGYYS